MDGKLLVERLLAYASAHLYLNETDKIYMRNALLSALRLSEPYEEEIDVSDIQMMDVPDELNRELTEYALENGLTDESSAERFCTDIFGMLTQLPSQINASFNQLREKEGPQAACDYLYDISVKNGYIQKTAIAKNLKWDYTDGSRRLEITVNLSKPEKKNKDIAKLLSAPQTKKYPACLLCKENEGFGGTASHPARRNIRTIKMTLGGEKWFMQYSPYAYYDEHCIVINEEHVPMNVDARTPDKLLDFVDLLPNYSIGSNASLPIVGGSILNHEHYQGGLHLMPMHSAGTIKNFRSEKYPSLRIGILDWYNSAIRIEGEDRTQVSALAAEIIEKWTDFSCEECNILSHTGQTRHNTVSPICRKVKNTYLFTLILRNNRTDEQFPDGIFHVHPEYQNIKSEGIGLIEAMGLFILPGRLKRQLDEIEDILCGKTEYDRAALEREDADLYVHRDMIASLLAEGKAKDKKEAHVRVQDRVNKVCAAILDNTAVFKKDEIGQKGFLKFMDRLALTEI